MSRIARFRRVVQAMRTDRDRAGTELLGAGQRAALQRERLDELVAHAVRHSPFYARWYGEHGVGPGSPLEDLPVLDKPTLMAAWDDVAADRRLRLADALDAVDNGDGTLHGHHIFRTGGSSGFPGVFAYDAEATHHLLAGFMRAMRYNGVSPRLPKRIGMSLVWAPGTAHMAARLAGLVDVGLYRLQKLPASAPVPELARRLQEHRPEVLGGYAATLGLLATAQLDGQLDIAPRVVIPSSEPLTPAIRERVRAAWGVEPFDAYATSETGPLGQECEAHRGLHIYEDATIVEPEDSRVLVTNLYNRGFPVIRFVLDDLVTADRAPCPCGRTTVRLTSIAGRANDILDLPAAGGGPPVSVHPTAWTAIPALDAVADAEVVQRNGSLTVRAVPRAGRDDAAEAVQRFVSEKLAELGVGDVHLRVETVDALPRTAAAKRKLVRREQP